MFEVKVSLNSGEYKSEAKGEGGNPLDAFINAIREFAFDPEIGDVYEILSVLKVEE